MDKTLNKTRLVYVCNDLQYFNRHWRHRALQALQQGYQVVVAVPQVPQNDESALQWESFPLNRQGMNGLAEARSLWYLRRLFQRIQPDLIHAITVKPNLHAGILARSMALPIVMSITGLGRLFTHDRFPLTWVRRQVLSLYRQIGKNRRAVFMFENQDDRQLFLDQGIGVPERCVRVPGAGVDMAIFYPQPEPDGVPVVMLCARMLWDKGVGEFLEAARLLRYRGVACRCVLVGDPDAGNSSAIPLERLEAWHREGLVEWWGHREDIPHVLAQANLVCLPSSYREGIPRVLIEAAACGRALVATDAPGCREIVRDGENGLLIPMFDGGALAEAIQQLIRFPELRLSMGRRGRQIAVADYGQEVVVEQTLGVYRGLCHQCSTK